jgi:hypothetical protein
LIYPWKSGGKEWKKGGSGMDDGFPCLIYRKPEDKRWNLRVQILPSRKEYCVHYENVVPADRNRQALAALRQLKNMVITGKIVKAKCKRAFAVSEVLEVYDDWKMLEVK